MSAERHTNLMRGALLVAVACLLAGCPTLHVDPFAEPLRQPKELPDETVTGAEAEQQEEGPARVSVPQPVIERSIAEGISDTLGQDLQGDPIRVSFNEMPLPAFIDQVFGEELGLSYVIAPGLREKPDLVTLRLTAPVPPAQLFDTARGVLREFGIDVRQDANVLTFVLSDEIGSGEIPLLVSGRTLPEVPATHRTIFHLVPLYVVAPSTVRDWLVQAFDRDQLRMEEYNDRNALLLSGRVELIAQALAMIEVLDQPLLRGRQGVLMTPRFVEAEDLARQLRELLEVQGYAISVGGGGGAAVLLPLETGNKLAVFVQHQKVMDLIDEWVEMLDTRGRDEIEDAIFTYRVQHTQAETLVGTVSEVLGIGSGMSGQVSGTPEAPAGFAGVAQGVTEQSRIVVDKNSNMLIFRGSGEDWGKVEELVRELDNPVPSVLVEVLIAEILLADQHRSGFEFFARGALGDFGVSGGTLNSLGLQPGSLSLVLESAGQTRALLSFFDEDSRVVIRSRPNLMVKSGESASIEVGNEIPTISQFSDAGTQIGGETNVLQSVSYRKTGINLQITPVVQASGLVDLEISQSLSEARPTAATSLEGSPTILNRQISTSLTLRDGGSLLMGGLISNNQSSGQVRVPLLAGIPGVGRLFRSDTFQEDRTELMVLVIPYVIADHREGWELTRQLRERLELHREYRE